MSTVRDVLDKKGADVWSVAPTTTMYDAVVQMAEKGIGALLVMDGQRLVGIVSERDYARKIILKGRGSRDTPVSAVMTTQVVSCSPETDVHAGMRTMSEGRFRHLPVLEGEQVVGLVSMGDLVKSIIAEQQSTIDELERYVSG